MFQNRKNSRNTPKNKFLFLFLDIFLNTAVIILIVVFVRSFIISPFQVSGNSMIGTLHDGDYIIIDKLSYRFSNPKRGDIIVFKPPINKKDYYVKRIIGLPGEEIEIKDGKVLIKANKKETEIQELYLLPDNMDNTYLSPNAKTKSFKIPENKYFVLGDNRIGSNDSRHWTDNKTGAPNPFVEKKDISGKVFVILWPFPDIKVMAKPSYSTP